jgi:hypothetical protein
MADLKVKEWATGDVHPYPGNPRINDDAVQAVAESLKEFGWKQPIVVDADGTVIAGHTRLKAAKRLGMETVPVIVASDLTPEQVQAYRLADNKVGELATWDMGKLGEELDGLLDFDMGRFGFVGGFDALATLEAEGLGREIADVAAEEFNVTLTFPAYAKQEVMAHIKNEGKGSIVRRIMDWAGVA